MLHAISFSIVLTLFMRTYAELYTSVAALEDLLKTEQRTIEDLELYIEKEEDRLAILKSYLHHFQKEHEKAMEDIPSYMNNPINAFTLIKRLTSDLNYFNKTIRDKSEENGDDKITMVHDDVKYPTKEDLAGAARGLVLLQKTYNLDGSELAEGKLNGVVYSSPMTTSDCYELGRALYDEGDYMNARAWLLHAFRKYYEEEVSYPFTDIDILDNINDTCYRLGDPKNAIEWTQNLLDIDPEHERIKEILSFYQILLNIELEESGIEKTKESIKKNITSTKATSDSYELLCRGDLEVPVKLSSRLTCRYMSESHPFLKLAPLKIELMYINPEIVLFHDIVSDGEIEVLKQMSIPKFRRALVRGPNGTTLVSNNRTSQLAWFKDQDDVTIARLSRRVSYMTGLSTAQAVTDELQVLNYGIGGHYKPHFDFFGLPDVPKPDEEIKGKGNRIATALFYMSNVPQGGATVFPVLGIKVSPVKGTAILWYNLHASGSRDKAVLHAACPVLHGSKWVFTKWIYQVGQELLRPCNLEYELIDHHTSKLLSPVYRTLNQAIQYSF